MVDLFRKVFGLDDIALLRALLVYEKDTGRLYWRRRPVEWFKPNSLGQMAAANAWNRRYAEQEAFTSTNGGGYRNGCVLRVNLKAHRVAWAIHHGRWPSEVDHLNGDKTDNRLDNLREVTRQINSCNRSRRSDNSSGAVGVDFYQGRTWRARLHTQGREVVIGYFDTMESAVAARKAAQLEYGFTERHGTMA
jgi:hypothetical protein